MTARIPNFVSLVWAKAEITRRYGFRHRPLDPAKREKIPAKRKRKRRALAMSWQPNPEPTSARAFSTAHRQEK